MAAPVWPSPARLVLGVLLSFTLTGAAAWLWGRACVEATLPLARHVLQLVDHRFTVLFLGTDLSHQDTVVRLRVNFAGPTVVGSQVVFPHPRGWLDVSTPVGSLLQPILIGCALAGAWPGALRQRVLRVAGAAALGVAFLVVDIPITLNTLVRDYVFHGAERFSAPSLWDAFLSAGGRLALGAVFAVLACAPWWPSHPRTRPA